MQFLFPFPRYVLSSVGPQLFIQSKQYKICYSGNNNNNALWYNLQDKKLIKLEKRKWEIKSKDDCNVNQEYMRENIISYWKYVFWKY
jgi:hypothetical protein